MMPLLKGVLALCATALLMSGGCREPLRNSVRGEYVGRQACKRCHQREFASYAGSHHDLAMGLATNETVLGDFEDASLTHFGVTSRFYRRDGKFLVSTEGASGAIEEFEVKYTFGVDPLQQYLVEFPGGRLQCLPLCWDARSKREGGQRWFHIYDRERISPGDVLFWTRISQNWNHMCAECHSTDLRKNFDASSRTYETRWSEIDVSCEACHGPAASHLEWAEARARGENRPAVRDLGLAVRLKEAEPALWTLDERTGNARRTPPLASQTQVEMCARCHSRRSLISQDYVHGESLLDTHAVSLLEEGLYYPDGQILDEVYVYGSFLQSRMAQEGVVCTDCHDPHSARLHVEGDALCARCHAARKYASPTHHHHPDDSPGARCVECHMPARTYMVVDPRRDHGFRAPRPDLTASLETPNACNGCHRDRSTQWSVKHFHQWYGTGPREKHFGETLADARKGLPGLGVELLRLTTTPQQPSIVRATAVSLLRNYPTPDPSRVLRKLVNDSSPMVRAAAVNALGLLPSNERAPWLGTALEDPVRLVRTLAGRTAAGISPEGLSAEERQKRTAAISEYEEAQRLNADHPAGHLNLGDLYRELRDYRRAEASYQQAIAVEPAFMPPYVNLADLYRQTNREAQGKQILLEALEIAPQSASAHYSLGLLLVRIGNRGEALGHLKRAAELEPDNSRHAYVYGVALNSLGNSRQAVAVLEQALGLRPHDRDLLFALATIHRDRKEFGRALVHSRQLLKFYPEEAGYRQLERQLRVLERRSR